MSLIKSEAGPIIHTLLQRLLSPHALLHSGGSAGGSDYGPVSTEERRGAPAPSLQQSDWDPGPRALPVLFPQSVRSSGGCRVTGGVTVDELWAAEKPREPCSSRDTFQADDLLHPTDGPVKRKGLASGFVTRAASPAGTPGEGRQVQMEASPSGVA